MASTGELIGHREGHFPYLDPKVNFSFTLPDGWLPADMSAVHAPNAVMGWGGPVGNVYVDGCRVTTQDPPLGPNVDDLAAVWASSRASPPRPRSTSRSMGTPASEWTSPCPPHDKTECVADEFLLWTGRPDGARAQQLQGNPHGNYWAWGPGQQRQWILDVDGTRLVIHESSERGTTPEQLADMEEFLASVQIG